MFLIKLSESLWVEKDRGRTLKGDAMVFQIPSRFAGVPLKSVLERLLHSGAIPRKTLPAKSLWSFDAG